MRRRIYFFAKVGDLNKIPYGGGELGNRRTMQMFKELGYKVILINRYYNYNKKSLLTYIKMILGDFISLVKLFLTLLCKTRNDSIVHISGFTGQYMPLEFSAVLISKLLGFKTTYEIRGGGIISNYKNGSLLYRIIFNLSIKFANLVFSQGLENKILIDAISTKKFFYYPNCVTSKFMPSTCPPKPKDSINLIYVGRITPQKNIDLIVKVLNELIIKGYNTRLDIIGDGEDCHEYVNKVKQYVTNHNLTERCKFHGKMKKEEMIPYLLSAIFFLFPTKEKREGQSNSLTETMSYGIIPIASSQGYNRTIINNSELIEDTFTVSSYVTKIINIWTTNRVTLLSTEMYNHILRNFTYDKVKESVRCIYNQFYE